MAGTKNPFNKQEMGPPFTLPPPKLTAWYPRHPLIWLFQLDDSEPLLGKWLFHQTSIKNGCLGFQEQYHFTCSSVLVLLRLVSEVEIRCNWQLPIINSICHQKTCFPRLFWHIPCLSCKCWSIKLLQTGS